VTGKHTCLGSGCRSGSACRPARRRHLRFHHHRHADMILQILAHSRQIDELWQTNSFKRLRPSNAGAVQDPRGGKSRRRRRSPLLLPGSDGSPAGRPVLCRPPACLARPVAAGRWKKWTHRSGGRPRARRSRLSCTHAAGTRRKSLSSCEVLTWSAAAAAATSKALASSACSASATSAG